MARFAVRFLTLIGYYPTVTHPDGKRFYRDRLDRGMPL